MGSHWNFKNMGGGDAPPLPSQAQAPAAADGSSGSGRPPGNLGNLSLARQASIYSLTFDEFQNTMGGNGKDFGSMNMDELIKNIWTAEEAQAMASSFGGGAVEGLPSGNLQRQGSLTLPRTLSQKTVDEVWRDLYKESFGGGKDGNSNGGSNLPQRQQTLGEITLEEFLVRAGVVREDMQAPPAKLNNNGFYPELMHVNNHHNNNDNNNNNPGLSLGFGQLSRNSVVIGSQITESNNPSSNQSPGVAINANGVRSPNGYHHHQQHQQQLKQSPQQLFHRQPNVAYASPLHLTNVPLGGQRTGGGIVGIGDPMLNNNIIHGGGLQGGRMGMGGLGVGTVTVATGSPANQLSSDGIVKSNGEMPSPVPSVFNGMRGKRSSGTLEKVVERRQRRMIKNRESAARSRARKQAYTMELEAEVAKLKEENQELQKKQAEILEMQKNQVLEIMNKRGLKKRCLRRTLTGPCNRTRSQDIHISGKQCISDLDEISSIWWVVYSSSFVSF